MFCTHSFKLTFQTKLQCTILCKSRQPSQTSCATCGQTIGQGCAEQGLQVCGYGQFLPLQQQNKEVLAGCLDTGNLQQLTNAWYQIAALNFPLIGGYVLCS